MTTTAFILVGVLLAAQPGRPVSQANQQQASQGNGQPVSKASQPPRTNRSPTKTDSRFAGLFQVHEYRYGKQPKQRLLQYQLFVPYPQKPGESYPLLVWLYHNDRFTTDHLTGILRDLHRIEKYRFFIVAIPCPSPEGDWFSSVGASDFTTADGALSFEIVQKVMREQPVNPDRISVIGISRSGTRCFEMASRYSELLASAVPMASAGVDLSRVAQLANLPIWAFHSREDTLTTPERVVQTVSAVKQAGGNIHLTFLPSDQHDCRKDVFGGYDIVQWMLSQRRGAYVCWTPPGCNPWRWWHIVAVPVLFLGIVRLTWFIKQKRRQA